ncbi:MAG: helix-turn-helix domain-containing protein [Desulfobacteraceae bacterium]|nr:helix-turn-helix domain-containing protein [Desulfobacteraceae bacterium]
MNWKLKATIHDRGFHTQGEFARSLGIQESVLSRVIRGTKSLSRDEQVKWAKALRANPEELFTQSGI